MYTLDLFKLGKSYLKTLFIVVFQTRLNDYFLNH